VIRVVFVLVPNIHLLDLAGPAQVFSGANNQLGEKNSPYELHYVAEHDTVTTHQGLPVQTTQSWPTLAPDDLVVVPGWRAPTLGSSGTLLPTTMQRIVAHHRSGGTVVSVCAGADALGRMGLLDSRRCTTHHELQDELAQRYPKAKVVRDVLFVDDDRVFSSAGIASGIDLALHIVAQRHGPAFAARVARTMVVYTRRNGDQAQQSAMLQHRIHLIDVVHRVQDVIDARFKEPLSAAELAQAQGVSVRTLGRSFQAAVGMSPLQYQQSLRVEHARNLLRSGSTMEAAANAVGFSDARMLRRLMARIEAH
jgi:transcriptional regulator GlxA family with amidase domain